MTGYSTMYTHLDNSKINLTLFHMGSGMTLTHGGGAIMARTDFRLSKVAKRPVSTQNLLSNRYFNV